LVERIDRHAEAHGYTGRSEVVRDASRTLLDQFADRDLEDRDLVGIVTVLFDYESSAAEERMISLRHEHESLVIANATITSGTDTAWNCSSSKGRLTGSPRSSAQSAPSATP
jgi:metal-responsive CopG/Arc/MetJ family transcriptional regulator